MNFERFHRSIFCQPAGTFLGSTNLVPKFCDRKVVFGLGRDIVVELTLDSGGTAGEYSGYRVRLVGRACGPLVETMFGFNDSMGTPGKADFRVVRHCCTNGIAEWYINRPNGEDVAAFAGKITDYLEAWRGGKLT
jgi:hypothetical protein